MRIMNVRDSRLFAKIASRVAPDFGPFIVRTINVDSTRIDSRGVIYVTCKGDETQLPGVDQVHLCLAFQSHFPGL